MITLELFLKLYENLKKRRCIHDEQETFDAFVACGGGPGKDAFIDRKVLEEIIKNEFEMTINIKELLDSVDENGDGEIQYAEFKMILDESKKNKKKAEKKKL